MADEDVSNLLKELSYNSIEIKKLSLTMKQLKMNRIDLESKIEKYLVSRNMEAVMDNNVIVSLKDIKKRRTKKAVEKKIDALKVLSECGVPSPDTIIDKVIDSMKGEQYTKKVVKTNAVKK